jgi:hypothetical protein
MTNDNNNNKSKKEEKVYYDKGNVKITSARAILDDKTYVLKNISSVTVNKQEYGAESSGAGSLWVGGGLCALVGIIVALSGGNVGVALIFFIVAGICFYVAYGKKGTPAWTAYSVRIGSNAGDSDSLKSIDKEYITKVVNAINDAIIENS